jgi:hypothetical protein
MAIVRFHLCDFTGTFTLEKRDNSNNIILILNKTCRDVDQDFSYLDIRIPYLNLTVRESYPFHLSQILTHN